MKKNIVSMMIAVLLIAILSFQVFGFAPQEGDIYFNLGAVPGKDLLITTVSNGIRLDFKKTGDQWAARAELEYAFNLSKPAGISTKLSNISWPVNGSSITICISMAQGGWSDSRSLLFRISNPDTEGQFPNGAVEGIFGFGSEETDHSIINFLPATALNNKVAKTIDFSFKKKNTNQWALTINGQEFIIQNSIVANKFTVMNPLYLNYGTWASEGAVSYVVADVFYDGAFGSNVSTPVSVSNSTSSSKTSSLIVSSVNPTSTIASSEIESLPQSSDSISSSISTSPDESQSDSVSVESSKIDTSSKDETGSKPGNIWIWIIIGAIVIFGGAGASFYYLKFKKKQ